MPENECRIGVYILYIMIIIECGRGPSAERDREKQREKERKRRERQPIYVIGVVDIMKKTRMINEQDKINMLRLSFSAEDRQTN